MAGRFVTVDGRVVFIGGPWAGGGSTTPGAGQVLTGSVPLLLTSLEVEDKIDNFMYGNLGPFGGKVERAKDQIVSDISELSGESYDDVNAVVGQWAQSSNDNDMRSLSLQRDAAEEFGIPLSDFTQGKIDASQSSSKAILPPDQQRRILRAMHDNTQSKLADAGFKPGDRIRLYRGGLH